MRYFVCILVTLALAACGTAPGTLDRSGDGDPATSAAPVSTTATPDTIVQFLLVSTVKDFREHSPMPALLFREIRVGSLTSSAGETRYLLCGQYRPESDGGPSEWTPFVTIRTSGYELYIGAQSAVWCANPAAKWDAADFTERLQGLYNHETHE